MKPDADPSHDAAAIEAQAAGWIARRDAGFSAEDERALRQWLDADPRHRAAVAFYDAAWTTLAKPAQAGVGTQFEQQIEALAVSRRRRRRNRWVATTTAAVVMLLGFGTFYWMRPGPVVAPAGTLARVLIPSRQTLPDGTVVDLKESARIALDYSPSMRRVALLSGEAHFDVTPDAARPFVVSAAGVEVRAVGTAFAVYRRDAAIEVMVTHGKVAVEKAVAERAADTAPVPLASLEAGRMAVVEVTASVATSEVRAIGPDELGRRLAWRSPRLEFSRTPLSEAVELMNRHTPPDTPRLAVSGPAVGTLRISGIFRADNAEAFVLLLEGTLDVKAERVGNTIELRPAAARP